MDKNLIDPKTSEEIKNWFRRIWGFEPLDEDVELYKDPDFRRNYFRQKTSELFRCFSMVRVDR